MSVEFEDLNKARDSRDDANTMLVEFSDEEGYGKYLDLHECYDAFINLKGAEVNKYLFRVIVLMLYLSVVLFF